VVVSGQQPRLRPDRPAGLRRHCHVPSASQDRPQAFYRGSHLKQYQGDVHEPYHLRQG